MNGRRTAACAALLAFGLLAVLGCGILKKDQAKTRAENILNGMKHGYLDSEWQTAVCMWYDGVVNLADQKELEEATDGFERWLRQAGIQTPITSYEITGVEVLDSFPPASIVTAKIDGGVYRMRVAKGDTVTWVGGGD